MKKGSSGWGGRDFQYESLSVFWKHRKETLKKQENVVLVLCFIGKEKYLTRARIRVQDYRLNREGNGGYKTCLFMLYSQRKKIKRKCQKCFIVEAYKIYSHINPLYPQNANNKLSSYKQNSEWSLPQKTYILNREITG